MELIPHDGISLISITRGFLGISTILVIAYLLSNNKKNIDWKTIGIGVLSQLIIAIGVIKVDAVAIFFEKIGITQKEYLILENKFSISIKELKKINNIWLEKYMN